MWSRWSLRRLLSAEASRWRRLSPRSLGVGPIGKATLLETKTSGKPFRSSPTTSSAAPLPYESSVSTMLTPASIASSTRRRALSRSTDAAVPPATGVNATDPNVRLETNNPLRPSCRNSIAASWRSPDYGNRWGLWQHKSAGRASSERQSTRLIRMLPLAGAAVLCSTGGGEWASRERPLPCRRTRIWSSSGGRVVGLGIVIVCQHSPPSVTAGCGSALARYPTITVGGALMRRGVELRHE